jgi:hypothetical protein
MVFLLRFSIQMGIQMLEVFISYFLFSFLLPDLHLLFPILLSLHHLFLSIYFVITPSPPLSIISLSSLSSRSGV